MSLRAHLLLSEAPQALSGPATALCGAKLAHAESVMMVDLAARGMPEFGMRDCAKCIRLAEHDPRLLPPETGAAGWAARRLYLYAICEGQEAQICA